MLLVICDFGACGEGYRIGALAGHSEFCAGCCLPLYFFIFYYLYFCLTVHLFCALLIYIQCDQKVNVGKLLSGMQVPSTGVEEHEAPAQLHNLMLKSIAMSTLYPFFKHCFFPPNFLFLWGF